MSPLRSSEKGLGEVREDFHEAGIRGLDTTGSRQAVQIGQGFQKPLDGDSEMFDMYVP